MEGERTPAARAQRQAYDRGEAARQARKQRDAAAAQAKRAAADDPVAILEDFNGQLAANITANSALLDSAQCRDDPLVREHIREEVKSDITEFGTVSDADASRCATAFVDAQRVTMLVCAACGVRNPDAVYKRRSVSSIDLDH